MLVMPQDEIMRRYCTTGLITAIDAEKLIIGALEEAFQAVDDEIKQERYDYRIDGGCTVVAAIFIKGNVLSHAAVKQAIFLERPSPFMIRQSRIIYEEPELFACFK